MTYWFKISALFLLMIVFLGAGCPLQIITRDSASGGDGGTFKTFDSGETWEQKTFVGQDEKRRFTIGSLSVRSLTFDPFNTDIVYLGTLANGIYRSENGGEQWVKLPVEGLIVDVAIHPQSPVIVYAVVGFSLLKSVDSGATWETVYTDSRGQLIQALVIDWFEPAHILITTNRSEVLESWDNGTTWQFVSSLLAVPKDIIMDPRDSRVLYIPVIGGNLYRSVDSGHTWELFLADGFAKFPGSNNIHGMIFYDARPALIFLATDYGLLRFDGDTGALSEISTLVQARALPITTFAVNPANDQEILFPVGKVIHKTDNGGQSWKIIENFPSSRQIITIVADPDKPGVYYAGTLVPRKK